MVRCGGCGDELPRAGFSSSQFSKPPGEQLCRTCAGPLPALGGAFWREAEQGPQRQAPGGMYVDAIAVAPLADGRQAVLPLGPACDVLQPIGGFSLALMDSLPKRAAWAGG